MDSKLTAKNFLKFAVITISLILFIPLLFQPGFRTLVALGLLGILYSWFLVDTWERLTDRIYGGTNPFSRLLTGVSKLFKFFFPVKAWGAVPCFIQLFILFCLFIFGFLLAPLYFEITRNPAIQGWVRDFLQTTAPEAYQFLDQLTYSPDPYRILMENARQIFNSLNSFFAVIVLPASFVLFTGIGAVIYEPAQKLFIQAEKSGKKYSDILSSYSRLMGEYLLFISIYYLLLGGIIAIVLETLNRFNITHFDGIIILGLVLVFLLGNLIVPGLGTLVATVLISGMISLWQGIIGGAIAGVIFLIYFTMDDYLIKPSFINWLGGGEKSRWDFGLETLILGLAIFYASFGLIGFLLVFPGLCFLDAYLRHQYPDIRPWLLSPIKMLGKMEE
ncbi:MAG: hypothetical protein ACQEP7_00435 [bacterium]